MENKNSIQFTHENNYLNTPLKFGLDGERPWDNKWFDEVNGMIICDFDLYEEQYERNIDALRKKSQPEPFSNAERENKDDKKGGHNDQEKKNQNIFGNG